jgi:hypothetical protein
MKSVGIVVRRTADCEPRTANFGLVAREYLHVTCSDSNDNHGSQSASICSSLGGFGPCHQSASIKYCQRSVVKQLYSLSLSAIIVTPTISMSQLELEDRESLPDPINDIQPVVLCRKCNSRMGGLRVHEPEGSSASKADCRGKICQTV